MKMNVFKIRLYVENWGHVSQQFSPQMNGVYPEIKKKIGRNPKCDRYRIKKD